MERQRGFTLVEILIVIVIMAILMVLAVVNLRSGQADARDVERKTDVANIARALEVYYDSGPSTSNTPAARYPSTSLVTYSDDEFTMNNLRDIDRDSLIAPGSSGTAGSDFSLIAATNTLETTTGIRPLPTPSTYVYQPLTSDNVLCISGSQECRRFNLYYRLETDSTIHMVTSDNQ